MVRDSGIEPLELVGCRIEKAYVTDLLQRENRRIPCLKSTFQAVVEATTNEIFLRSVEVQLAIFYIRINSGGDESSNHTDRLFLTNIDDSRKLKIIT